MRFNFRKIASVLAGAVMLSSTVGFAAAASYPEPFVAGGTADAAVVVGANAAVSDWSAAIDLQQNLNGLVTSSSSSSSASVSGEAAPLFTSGTKLYINDSLNSVKNVLTKTDLPTVLAKETFSGNVDASITQTIDIGFDPRVVFKKQPTNSDDPEFGLELSTNDALYMYNATATFSKAINFTNADSEGESISLFGQTFTVGSATDATSLVLLQSAEKLSLDSDNPTAEVTVGGETYTIELVSASDDSATIQVTDANGNTNSKEINEADSKKVGSITIAVTNADETNLKLSASLVAGAEKVTFQDGAAVTYGESDTVIDGTLVSFTGDTGAMTKLSVSVSATSSDADALKPGESFTDPVFGTFKLDFAGLNIADDSSAREDISIQNSGDDKLEVTFADHSGVEKTIPFVYNYSSGIGLMHNDDYKNITVREEGVIKYQDYVVVGNEDEGHLLELTAVRNSSTAGFDQDYVKFKDIFSGDTLETTWTNDAGIGTITVGGKSYTVTLVGTSDNETEDYQVRLDWSESTSNQMIVYPTIQTSKGAKLAFYEPLTIDFSDWDGSGNTIEGILIPDGDGFETIGITHAGAGPDELWNITDGTTVKQLNLTASAATGNVQSVIIGDALNFTFTGTAAANTSLLQLDKVGGAGVINLPGLFILEEKDDNNQYQGLILVIENGQNADDGIGVDDVERTWGNDGSSWEQTMASDSKITKEADLWGTIISLDSSDSDQKTAMISYPDEQVYAQIYIAEESAAITPGTSSGGGLGGQVVIVKDTEVSSVASKNLVVVGGSCINKAAAKILGSDTPLCSADFTDKTGVGANQYIIKTVDSPYGTGKVAMLVAGYEAADTVNAVAKAMEGATSDVDTEQVYPIVSA